MRAVAIAIYTLILGCPWCCLDAQLLQPPEAVTLAAKGSAAPYVIQFPQDLYDHPSYQTEWWYFTGNLDAPIGKHYGFELTFFRSYAPTGAPPGQPQYIPIIFADLAVSDLDGRQFFFHKSLAPEVAPLASINEQPWVIQLGSWTLSEPDSTSGIFRLNAQQDNFGVDLALLPEGKPVLNGVNGLFELDGSDGQGDELYEYYSYPRMLTAGLIRVNGEVIPVHGMTWNDHEFFNLGPDQQFPSWDWFSIQLNDGSSLMLYGLRLPDGRYDPASRGTFIAPDGAVTHLQPGDFTLVPGQTWHSIVSDADYPIAWTIRIPSLSIELAMSTPLVDQELPAVEGGGSPAYWEGASRFHGTRQRRPVDGKGYVELLGYAKQ